MKSSGFLLTGYVPSKSNTIYLAIDMKVDLSLRLYYQYIKLFVLFSFPFLYLQGRRIRKKIPKLPEAKDPAGTVESGNGSAVKILILGESTMAGVGVGKHADGFAGSFSKKFAASFHRPVDWYVYARSGATAGSLLDKILPQVIEKRFDLILIGLGANDAFMLNKPSTWNKNIRKIIDLLQGCYSGVPIVFCNMPPVESFPAFTPLIRYLLGNQIKLLGEVLHIIAEETSNVYYNEERIDIGVWSKKHLMKPDKDQLFSDGVHPSQLTYKIWGTEMVSYILSHSSLRAKLSGK